MRAAFLSGLACGCIPHLETQPGDDPTTSATECAPWVAVDNAWSDGAVGPDEALCGEGYADGQVAPDVRLSDQNGDTVSLWQFYGDVIVLDVSTIWCVPCQALGGTAEQTYQGRADQGFMYVTVLQQDNDGNPPDQTDLNTWVDGFGLSTPVLGDGDDPAVTVDALSQPGKFPGVLLIGRDMKVITRIDPPDDATLTAAVDAAL